MDTLECLSCGKRRPREDKSHPLERWLDFLPLDHIDPELSHGEGNTPLVPLKKLASEAGLPGDGPDGYRLSRAFTM